MYTTQSLPLPISIAFSKVRISVTDVTNTVGFRSLIALGSDVTMISPLVPSVCMTYQWRLDTSTLLWSTTGMILKPLVAKNRRRVGLIPPSLMASTNNDRNLRWTNTQNPYESRS